MTNPRQMVRAALRDILLSDDEFIAFCMDNYPKVFKRFSSGMNRLQKENLLLEMASTESIYNNLISSQICAARKITKRRIWIFFSMATPAISLFIYAIYSSDFTRRNGLLTACIDSSPSGAVIIDNETNSVVGHTPNCHKHQIQNNSATYTIQLSGFEQEQISVTRRDNASISVHLKKKKLQSIIQH